MLRGKWYLNGDQVKFLAFLFSRCFLGQYSRLLVVLMLFQTSILTHTHTHVIANRMLHYLVDLFHGSRLQCHSLRAAFTTDAADRQDDSIESVRSHKPVQRALSKKKPLGLTGILGCVWFQAQNQNLRIWHSD